jgi:hypothetical protein
MKQLKFVTMSAALFAATTLMSSCFRTDDPVKYADIKVAAETYSIIASSNAEVTYTIDVPATETVSSDKKEISFTDIDTKNKIVKVTATLVNPEGYVKSTQTAEITFSSVSSSVSIAFNFTQRSTETATPKDVENSTTDVVLNANLSDIKTTMTIPAGTVVFEGDVPGDYSITTYHPAPNLVDMSELRVGHKIRIDARNGEFTMNGTPQVAAFTNSITLTIEVGKELAGESFTVINSFGDTMTSTVDANGFVSFVVDDISSWGGVFETTVTKMEKGTVTLLDKSNVSLEAGNNTYKYTKNVGIETDLTGFLLSYFKSKFGNTLTKLETEGTIRSSNAHSKANIKVIQKYTDVTLSYGNVLFTVRVWGTAETTVTVDGHSGGNGF